MHLIATFYYFATFITFFYDNPTYSKHRHLLFKSNFILFASLFPDKHNLLSNLPILIYSGTDTGYSL
jgi:hypothetical protein